MAKDKNALLALVSTNKPDNSTQLITPAKSREIDQQIINSSANLCELTLQEFSGPVKISNLTGQDYLEIVRSSASYTQTGGALDTIQPITFDVVDRVSADGTVSIFADGTISSTETRPIMFKQVTEVGRTSSSGNVEAFFHIEFSTDDGLTWLPAGGSFNRRISNPNSVSVVFDFSPFMIQAGVLYRSTWAQSSVGGDPASPTTGVADAELIYSEPSAALKALGMANSSSASIIIYAKG